MNFPFHPLAKEEFKQFIDYYEKCQKGLDLHTQSKTKLASLSIFTLYFQLVIMKF